MKRVRWGILGAARIALNRVIPAMQLGELSEIVGIASRDRGRAEEVARQFGIPKAYGSYDEMLEDREIEAVYNPLPNHLHVPLSILAAQAGKHVLCEKPVGLDAADALKLLAARDRYGVEIGEAFMVQVHPQWRRTVELVRGGSIGKLRFAMGSFGYYNDDRTNVRNIREYGGGGLMDIGCYPIKTSRMVFGEEPVRVAATLVRDPDTGVDTLASAILEYRSGHAIFNCGTQVVAHQNMQFFGTSGRIEIEVPFNPLSGGASRIRVDDGRDPFGSGVTVEEFPPCDQYTLQGDAFSRAIRTGTTAPVPLEDSVKNMAVIDAVFRAAESGGWERPGTVSAAEQGS